MSNSWLISENHYDATINAVAHCTEPMEMKIGVQKAMDCLKTESLKALKTDTMDTANEQRKKRGHHIYKLYKQYPILEENKNKRTPEGNVQRKEIWIDITTKINETFGTVLGEISIDSAKKLTDYWKRRLESPHQPDLKEAVDVSHREFSCLTSPLDANLNSKQSTCPSDLPPPIFSANSSFYTGNCFLWTSLSRSPSTECSASNNFPISSDDTAKRVQILSRILRKHEREAQKSLVNYRLRFLVHSVYVYMRTDEHIKRTRSRSPESNKRRRKMWIEVTEFVNKKFQGQLKPLHQSQMKKSFSNFKGRRGLRKHDWRSKECLELLHFEKQTKDRRDEVMAIRWLLCSILECQKNVTEPVLRNLFVSCN